MCEGALRHVPCAARQHRAAGLWTLRKEGRTSTHRAKQTIPYTTVVNVPGAGASPFRVLTEGEEQGGRDGKRK